MNGPEHYREAERLVAASARIIQGATANTFGEAAAGSRDVLTAAQVHATLALAAATAMGTTGVPADGDTALEWRRTINGTKISNSGAST